MTNQTLVQQAADPLVRGVHIAVVLGCGEPSLNKYIAVGRFPKPDGHGFGMVKLWKLSTLRAWNPGLADNLENLLTHPALGSVKIAA
jgi:predicted DNA-binding transcriptional regulator AlpA